MDYTGFSTINVQRFGQKFVGKVANPHDVLLWHKVRGFSAGAPSPSAGASPSQDELLLLASIATAIKHCVLSEGSGFSPMFGVLYSFVRQAAAPEARGPNAVQGAMEQLIPHVLSPPKDPCTVSHAAARQERGPNAVQLPDGAVAAPGCRSTPKGYCVSVP